MKSVFVDTSYLLALVLRDDEHHRIAIEWQRYLKASLFTTELVLIEFCNRLWRPVHRSLAVNTLNVLRQSASVIIIPSDSKQFVAGTEYFARHRDKEWSLIDCISFLEMQNRRLKEALTSDHHFEQAGFRALLRTTPPT